MDFSESNGGAEDWLSEHPLEVSEIEALLVQTNFGSNEYLGLSAESTDDLQEWLEWLDTELEQSRVALHDGHKCNDHLDLRTREFSSGSKHFVYQCLICGEQRNSPLGKKVALEKNGGSKPPRFDDSIATNYYEQRYEISKDLSAINEIKRRVFARINGYDRLNDTFISDELNRKREQEFKQEKKRLADLTSRLHKVLEELEAEFGDEKAIQLLTEQTIFRKKRRYEERKKSIERFSDEDELKAWLVKNLSPDFYIEKEVTGVYQSENKVEMGNVRIDFVLRAKIHLIEQGFYTEPFGIEVKHFKIENKFIRQASRAVWQAATYNDSLFSSGSDQFKIKFCLLFSNLSFCSETELMSNFLDEKFEKYVNWRGMLHVALHARVGTLDIRGYKDSMKAWSIMFAGGCYFDASFYDNEARYKLSNVNILAKERIGNFS